MSNVHTSANVSFLFSKQVFEWILPRESLWIIYLLIFLFFVCHLVCRGCKRLSLSVTEVPFQLILLYRCLHRREGKKKHSRTFDAMLESSHLGFHKKGDQSWFPEQLFDSLLSFSPRRNTCSFPQMDSLNAHQSVCVSVCTSQLLMVSAPKKTDRAVSGWHTGLWIVAQAQ